MTLEDLDKIFFGIKEEVSSSQEICKHHFNELREQLYLLERKIDSIRTMVFTTFIICTAAFINWAIGFVVALANIYVGK